MRLAILMNVYKTLEETETSDESKVYLQLTTFQKPRSALKFEAAMIKITVPGVYSYTRKLTQQ